MTVPFCTCESRNCPHHPAGHQQGCTPCIRKNLDRGEIPACFFRKVSPSAGELTEYTMESFARFVEQHRGASAPEK